MTTQLQIIFYSMFGHVYRLAEAIAQGAREVTDVEVALYRVPELLSEDFLIKSGAKAAQEKFAHISIITPAQLADADGIIFGTPTRYGNMCAQMRNFLDHTGEIWAKNQLVSKTGSVFTSTSTQHAGQETTLTSFHTNLLHFGMLIIGVPFTAGLSNIEEVNGGTPYGASTITGSGKDARLPSETELAIARYQGKYVAEITRALKHGRNLV